MPPWTVWMSFWTETSSSTKTWSKNWTASIAATKIFIAISITSNPTSPRILSRRKARLFNVSRPLRIPQFGYKMKSQPIDRILNIWIESMSTRKWHSVRKIYRVRSNCGLDGWCRNNANCTSLSWCWRRRGSSKNRDWLNWRLLKGRGNKMRDMLRGRNVWERKDNKDCEKMMKKSINRSLKEKHRTRASSAIGQKRV